MDSVFAGTGLAGMRQRDLIQWYVAQQNEKNNYSSMEEAANEVSKIKAIIEVTNNHAFYQVCNFFFGANHFNQQMLVVQSLVRREGHLIVVDDGRQSAEGEAAEQSSSVSRNDRILAVAPNYVID